MSVVVEVHYIRQDNGGMIGAEQVTLTEGQHPVTANDSGLSNYVRQGEATVIVTVGSDGSASPSPVIFYYLPAAAPTEPPATENVPTLSGSAGTASGGPFDVYTGPGAQYYQVAGAALADGTAVTVYGSENGMALISFTSAAGGQRTGYVDSAALGGAPAALTLSSYGKVSTAPFTLTEGTDGRSELSLNYPAGTSFTLLAYLDNSWAYVEIADAGDGRPVRGFIPTAVF